ncbi:MAG: glycine betaine/L-proline ABC transporter ATP-binding protein [Alphaproteobacteria bacterium]|jgi:glycine betaine/proline transport system ATP-binding protein|nr:glycine betaine/L-proline ABC transporter ATP-binding protein [Alphaproteobacteria bacterium]|tara:strand:+ start:2677 stop:3726 length:1050 start_codon:yes stop_codon:yes gene_type:complete
MVNIEENKIKFSCKNLWKLFGNKPEEFLKNKNYNPSEADLKEFNIIGAVQNANIEILEGEIFVIMGLSGSGKSTLVRCLSRLIESTHGQIYFENSDLRKMSDKELIDLRRHKMGMVFQNFALLPHMTVFGNVMFPLEIQGSKKDEIKKKALKVIELVGLKGRENYFPKELSGGQQQRVGIARSLAVDPEVWFLDEPFSALDPLIRKEMQDEFLRLQNLLHKTIIFITHDFDEAIKLADRIAIMKDGLIIQVGTPEQLVINPATNYVKEFTNDILRSKVLTASSIMEKISNKTNNYIKINEKSVVESFAADLIDNNKNALVVNDENKEVGIITKEKVIDILINRDNKISR